jgi:hypothetical protein
MQSGELGLQQICAFKQPIYSLILRNRRNSLRFFAVAAQTREISPSFNSLADSCL